jgi:oxaloacetate decarboxylase gamma subunit
MSIVEMLGQSAQLMVMGMGVVFLFIVIMIIGLTLVHKAVHALKLDVEEAPQAQAVSVSQDTAVVAAIAAALRNKI